MTTPQPVARRGRGRPAKPPAERQTEPVTVRFTSAEYEELCRAARTTRVSLCALIRLRAMAGR